MSRQKQYLDDKGVDHKGKHRVEWKNKKHKKDAHKLYLRIKEERARITISEDRGKEEERNTDFSLKKNKTERRDGSVQA